MARDSTKRVNPTLPKRKLKQFVGEVPSPKEGILSFNFKFLEEKTDKFKYQEKDKQYL